MSNWSPFLTNNKHPLGIHVLSPFNNDERLFDWNITENVTETGFNDII